MMTSSVTTIEIAARKRRWVPPYKLLTLGGVVALLVFALPHIRYNHSTSEPRGVYWLDYYRSVQRGDFVTVSTVLKQIAAVSGDVVLFTPEGVVINGSLWQNSAPLRPYTPFPFGRYVVQPGQVLLLSHNKRGFDGRYIGFVPTNLLEAIAVPVLTER